MALHHSEPTSNFGRRVSQVGGTGVSLSGGDRATLAPGAHVARLFNRCTEIKGL